MADALPPDDEGSGGETSDFYNNPAVYFMGIALLCEKRSKDPRRQVGACVVSKDGHRVIGTGYNGMPLNCNDCLMPWKKKRKIEHQGDDGQQVKEEGEKHDYVCHAEMNALVNKDPKSVEGGTLYVTLFPCNECAKVIVRSGIAKVVYLSDDKHEEEAFKAGKKLLTKNLATNGLLQFDEYKEPKKQVLDFMEGITKKESICDTTKARKKRKKQKISWEQFFMALAKLSAERSSNAKQGVCIVNEDKRIVGLGYLNHDLMQQDHAGQDDSSLYVCHAPVNAIVNENPTSLRGCTMYVTHFPCKECAKVIVQSGICNIVFLEKIKFKNEEMDLKTLPEGCYVVKPRNPKEKKSGKGKQDEEVDATTRMFAIVGIDTKKYSIEVALDDFNNWKKMYAIAKRVADKYEIECNLGDIKDWRRMFAIALKTADKEKDDISEIKKGKKFAEDLAMETEIELDYAKVIPNESASCEAPSNPTGQTS